MAIESAKSGIGEMTESSEEITASIPMELAGGQTVKPGDVLRLEVVSMDGDGITVKYAASGDNMKPERSTISEAAALFKDEGGEA